MKKLVTFLLALIFSGCLSSCKTQYNLKHNIYNDIVKLESQIDLTVKTFSEPDPTNDQIVISTLTTLDNNVDNIHDAKLRRNLKLFVSLSRKIVLLHQDPRLNYAALGPVLNLYTQTVVGLKESLTAYKIERV
jgi:hypothetical protein